MTLNMIRRGKNGRLQLVASGEGRWNAEVEAEFQAVLRVTGNVRAAAKAVGFSESSVWQRRREWPAFARMLEETLEEAELALEFRIAAMGSNVIASGAKHSSGSDNEAGTGLPRRSAARNDDHEQSVPFDMDAAMRFLKWREEKRRGRGRRTPHAKPPSIDEVTEKIVRRVEAIKRHRRRAGK